MSASVHIHDIVAVTPMSYQGLEAFSVGIAYMCEQGLTDYDADKDEFALGEHYNQAHRMILSLKTGLRAWQQVADSKAGDDVLNRAEAALEKLAIRIAPNRGWACDGKA